MRVIAYLTIIVLLLTTIVVSAQQTNINFSGEWALNRDKSDFGSGRAGRRGRGMRSSKMVVEQKDDKLVVERFRINRDGEEVSTKYTYSLNGKRSKNEGNFGTTISVAKWSKDGKKLIIESSISFSRGNMEFTMESTAKWSLDKDILTIKSTRTTPRGERNSTAVYNRVEKKK